MTLWGSALFRSGRVLWALEELAELGTPMNFKHEDVPSRGPETHGNPEFMRLNPAGKIPVLIDGDFVINESAAIMNYLSDKARALGATKSLAPLSGTPARARYDAFCFFVMSELDAQGMYIPRKHAVGGPLREQYGEDAQAVAAAAEYYKKNLKVLADNLRESKAPYLMGEDFSCADILLCNVCCAGANLGWFPWDDEALVEYMRRIVVRPAFVKTQAKLNKGIINKLNDPNFELKIQTTMGPGPTYKAKAKL